MARWAFVLSLGAALIVAAWQLYTHRGRSYWLVDDGVNTRRFYYYAASTQMEDE